MHVRRAKPKWPTAPPLPQVIYTGWLQPCIPSRGFSSISCDGVSSQWVSSCFQWLKVSASCVKSAHSVNLECRTEVDLPRNAASSRQDPGLYDVTIWSRELSFCGQRTSINRKKNYAVCLLVIEIYVNRILQRLCSYCVKTIICILYYDMINYQDFQEIKPIWFKIGQFLCEIQIFVWM